MHDVIKEETAEAVSFFRLLVSPGVLKNVLYPVSFSFLHCPGSNAREYITFTI
jgi:hypothetical protein